MTIWADMLKPESLTLLFCNSRKRRVFSEVNVVSCLVAADMPLPAAFPEQQSYNSVILLGRSNAYVGSSLNKVSQGR